jgi:hypothetical protein
MKLADEIKMALRKYILPFYDPSIKEAYCVIYELNRILEEKHFDSINYWKEISYKIERLLILKPDKFILKLNENSLSPRDQVYIFAANLAANELNYCDMIELSKRHSLKLIIEILQSKISIKET